MYRNVVPSQDNQQPGTDLPKKKPHLGSGLESNGALLHSGFGFLSEEKELVVFWLSGQGRDSRVCLAHREK